MSDFLPFTFFFGIMKKIVLMLQDYSVAGVSLYVWIISFILLSIVASVFWRGARG